MNLQTGPFLGTEREVKIPKMRETKKTQTNLLDTTRQGDCGGAAETLRRHVRAAARHGDPCVLGRKRVLCCGALEAVLPSASGAGHSGPPGPRAHLCLCKALALPRGFASESATISHKRCKTQKHTRKTHRGRRRLRGPKGRCPRPRTKPQVANATLCAQSIANSPRR